eukprot:g4159.t1
MKGQRFAVKMVRAKNNRQWEAVLEEVKLLEALQLKNSRHVVRMFRSLEVPCQLVVWLLLEYADCDMAEYIRMRNEDDGGRGVLPPKNSSKDHSCLRLGTRSEVGMTFLEVHECFLQMLRGLEHIHRHKIVHSDVKPANFLLVRGRIKLSDFGLARRIQDGQTHVSRHAQCGTVRFMAPEQIFQPANVCGATDDGFGGAAFGVDRSRNLCAPFHLKPSVDVWSVGIVLYLMLYLQTPFQQLERKLGGCRMSIMFAISDPRVQVLYPALEGLATKRWRCVKIAEEHHLKALHLEASHRSDRQNDGAQPVAASAPAAMGQEPRKFPAKTG